MENVLNIGLASLIIGAIGFLLVCIIGGAGVGIDTWLKNRLASMPVHTEIITAHEVQFSKQAESRLRVYDEAKEKYYYPQEVGVGAFGFAFKINEEMPYRSGICMNGYGTAPFKKIVLQVKAGDAWVSVT